MAEPRALHSLFLSLCSFLKDDVGRDWAVLVAGVIATAAATVGLYFVRQKLDAI